MFQLNRFGKSLISLMLVGCMLCSFGITAFASDVELPAAVEPTADVPVVQEQLQVVQQEKTAVVETPAAVKEEPAAEAASVQESTKAEQPAENAEQTEPEVKLYSWVHPITKRVYTNLTWEQYCELLKKWEIEKKTLTDSGEYTEEAEPVTDAEDETVDDTDEEAEEAAEEAEDAEDAVAAVDEEETDKAVISEDEELPAESDAEEAEEDAEVEEAEEVEEVDAADEEADAADYTVEYQIGDKVVKASGSKGISVEELLAGFGIELPEGAVVSIDPDSVDTKNLTVAEVDGKLMLLSNGAFYAADRDLVILVDGVATVVKVTDGQSAAYFEAVTAPEGASVKLKDDVAIDYSETNSITYDSGKTVIDLNGHTIKGGNADYMFEIKGSDDEKPVKVTFMNGTIEATKNAIKVVGNAIVDFFDMTVKAAKEVLHLDSSENSDKVATKANVDAKTTLISADEKSKTPAVADTIVLEGNNSDLYVNGTVINSNKGFAIGKTGADPAKDDSYIVLGSKAKLSSNSPYGTLSPKISAKSIFSKGASFNSGKGLWGKFRLILDVNYDTDYRYITVDSKYSLPANPTRPGYEFVGWNTEPDGTGLYMTIEQAMEDGAYDWLYAMWTPVNPNYAWLIRGTIDVGGIDCIAQTRMKIVDKVATIYFQYNSSDHRKPIKVEFLDVKRLMDMGAKIAKVQLDQEFYLELNLKDILDKGESASIAKVNTILLERDEDHLVTVTSGKTDVFCFNIKEMDAVTHNDLILRYENDTVTVFFGKDKVCDTKLPAGQFSKIKLDKGEEVLSVSKVK